MSSCCYGIHVDGHLIDGSQFQIQLVMGICCVDVASVHSGFESGYNVGLLWTTGLSIVCKISFVNIAPV